MTSSEQGRGVPLATGLTGVGEHRSPKSSTAVHLVRFAVTVISLLLGSLATFTLVTAVDPSGSRINLGGMSLEADRWFHFYATVPASLVLIFACIAYLDRAAPARVRTWGWSAVLGVILTSPGLLAVFLACVFAIAGPPSAAPSSDFYARTFLGPLYLVPAFLYYCFAARVEFRRLRSRAGLPAPNDAAMRYFLAGAVPVALLAATSVVLALP